MPKISPELMTRIENARAETQEIPVIVTLAPGTDAAVLDSTGLKVGRGMENIPAVAGTVAADDVAKLAELSEVVRVEYDGEMHAL
jgi:hypothetical protein